MRAPISIIIPTLNAAAALPGCLATLMEGLEAGLIRELIVVDGGSHDDTQAIARSWGANLLQTAPSRGGQLRAGCAAAQGDWLLVLHADTQLAPGWTGPVREHLTGGQAGWFHLRFDRGGGPVAGWANLRSRLFGLPFGDQGLLLPKSLYDRAGGYPDQPLMEDVALARALNGQLRPIGAVATTSAARYRKSGWLRRGSRNLVTLARYFAGTDPEVLARAYRRH